MTDPVPPKPGQKLDVNGNPEREDIFDHIGGKKNPSDQNMPSFSTESEKLAYEFVGAVLDKVAPQKETKKTTNPGNFPQSPADLKKEQSTGKIEEPDRAAEDDLQKEPGEPEKSEEEVKQTSEKDLQEKPETMPEDGLPKKATNANRQALKNGEIDKRVSEVKKPSANAGGGVYKKITAWTKKFSGPSGTAPGA